MRVTSKLKIFSACLACFLFGNHSYAQRSFVPVTTVEKIDLSVNWMEENLCLTEKQVVLVSLLNDRYTVRFDSIRLSTADRFVKYKKIRYVRNERDNELKFILTERQFKTYRYEQERVEEMFQDWLE
jgi:hypothetical protein